MKITRNNHPNRILIAHINTHLVLADDFALQDCPIRWIQNSPLRLHMKDNTPRKSPLLQTSHRPRQHLECIGHHEAMPRAASL